jgi:hypothetical protein
MSVERMGVDVEEVVLRTMFGAAQVHSETCRSKGSKLDSTFMIAECGAGDMGKCGLVSKAWEKEFKAWLASEEKRVTEVMWERAARDGVELCCSMKYKLEECAVPYASDVGYLLVFERRQVVQVVFERIEEGVGKLLGTKVRKWPSLATGARMMPVPGVVWSSERKWVRQQYKYGSSSFVVPPNEMDEALAQERDVVEGWETATVAELVEWLRATFAGL